MITATRYHDVSFGHRVFGHESKCAHLHGHNYRFIFTISPDNKGLDRLGRVLDFSVIKSTLCVWLEENWDHKFLLWEGDLGVLAALSGIDPAGVVSVPFNPTAENLARYMVTEIGPRLLRTHNCSLITCTVEETRKCSATFQLQDTQ